MTSLKVLVSGSRNWNHKKVIHLLMQGLAQHSDGASVIQGGAKGADLMCESEAVQAGVPVVTVEAEWEQFGMSAGPLRNARMVELGPDVLFAFKDDFDHSLRRGGTEDCVRKALAANIPVYVVQSLSSNHGQDVTDLERVCCCGLEKKLKRAYVRIAELEGQLS